MEHTSGPWTIIGSVDDIWVDDGISKLTVIKRAPDNLTARVIARVFAHCPNERIDRPNLEANARLIEQAPALLKTLKRLLEATKAQSRGCPACGCGPHAGERRHYEPCSVTIAEAVIEAVKGGA